MQEQLRIENEIQNVDDDLELVTVNMSRAKSESQFEAIAKQFDSLEAKKAALGVELKKIRLKKSKNSDSKDRVAMALEQAGRLFNLNLDNTEDFATAREALEL